MFYVKTQMITIIYRVIYNDYRRKGFICCTMDKDIKTIWQVISNSDILWIHGLNSWFDYFKQVEEDINTSPKWIDVVATTVSAVVVLSIIIVTVIVMICKSHHGTGKNIIYHH